MKPLLEHLAYKNRACPVIIRWVKGKINKTRKLYCLAHHREVEFLYIKEGQASYYLNGKKYHLGKHALLFIRPYEMHTFIPCPDSYLEKCRISFPWSFLKENRQRLRFPPDFPRHIQLSESEAMKVEIIIIHCLQEEKEKKSYWIDIIREKLKEFVFLIKRAGQRPEPPRRENPIASQLVDYLEKNYTQSLPIPLLAQKFGFSNNYLSALFQKHTGVGIKQYILQRRILEAKKMIDTCPALKTGVIAEKTGFDSFVLFNHAFKKFTGLTPGKYRRILYNA